MYLSLLPSHYFLKMRNERVFLPQSEERGNYANDLEYRCLSRQTAFYTAAAAADAEIGLAALPAR